LAKASRLSSAMATVEGFLMVLPLIDKFLVKIASVTASCSSPISSQAFCKDGRVSSQTLATCSSSCSKVTFPKCKTAAANANTVCWSPVARPIRAKQSNVSAKSLASFSLFSTVFEPRYRKVEAPPSIPSFSRVSAPAPAKSW